MDPEKAMAPHSSTLAWKIPWMEEPGRLQSMGSLIQTRLSNFTSTFTFMHWRREPTPVFLPGESQGQGSLVGVRHNIKVCWPGLQSQLRQNWGRSHFVAHIRSDQISHSVVSNSLRPHESQHARPPCPSPTPGVHSDSCPSSQ